MGGHRSNDLQQLDLIWNDDVFSTLHRTCLLSLSLSLPKIVTGKHLMKDNRRLLTLS